jgi:hypothetical protein
MMTVSVTTIRFDIDFLRFARPEGRQIRSNRPKRAAHPRIFNRAR